MDSVNGGITRRKSGIYGLVLIASKIGAKLIPILAKLIKGVLGFKGVGVVGSLGLYSFLFSWQMGMALVAFLFVHEYGHLWAMKKCGLKTKGIYLIPGFGAAAIAAEKWKSSRNEAYIALMGPMVSLLFIGPMVGLYLTTKNPMFAAIASIMSFINLINLFPINPLDGGRIVKALLYSFRGSFGFFFSFFSLAIAAVVANYTGMYLLAFIAVLGIWEAIADYGLIDHLSSLIKTGFRIILGLCSLVIFATLIISVEAGVWWKIILFSVLSLLAILMIIIDIKGAAEREKRSVLAYPVLMAKDAWQGIVSLFSIKPEHLERVEQYEKMSKGTVFLYSFLYIVALISMVGLIMYSNSVPGCQLAKEFLM